MHTNKRKSLNQQQGRALKEYLVLLENHTRGYKVDL